MHATRPAPRATRREIGEWVTELAQAALAERTRMVAVLENWSEGPQIPLSSSPFASEIPPPIAPLPAHDSDALSAALRDSLTVSATALAKASSQRPVRAQRSVVWLLLAVVVALIVGYVAHR